MTPRFGVIRQRVTAKASPAQVYRAFADPRIHWEFTGSPATGSRRAGSGFTAWDGYITGKILELEEGKKGVQEWSASEGPKGYPPPILTLTFEPRGRGTELSMVHSKVPVEQVSMYAEGRVTSYRDPLKEYSQERE